MKIPLILLIAVSLSACASKPKDIEIRGNEVKEQTIPADEQSILNSEWFNDQRDCEALYDTEIEQIDCMKAKGWQF